MMKHLLYFSIIMGSFLASCEKTIEGISFDDLSDKQEYPEGLTINGSYYKNQLVERILVNGEAYSPDVTLLLQESGFYRIEVFRKGGEANNPDLFRIVILDDERGEAEWGLKKWTPGIIPIGLMDERLITVVHPAKYPQGVNVPLIVKAEGERNQANHNYKGRIGSVSFLIKQGIGSVQIPSGDITDATLNIDHRYFPLMINVFESPPLLLHGQLSADTHIKAETFVRIEEDLIIPSGVTLEIDSGVFITLDPGINVYNEGSIIIKGSLKFPVTFTCSQSGEFWGGFIGSGQGNLIEAVHTIFCQSGYHTEGVYNYGHAHRQALIYSEFGSLAFDHCYMIDHIGQVFYPVSASLELRNSLIQRAKTGGQINNSELTIHNSVFTDFPDDSQNYQDEDNDALYLMGTNATISESLFMYAKDDGLDSGGSGGGVILISNTRFLSVFHEGAALSSAGDVIKTHQFAGCTFSNCGQGLELGYSSPNHIVLVDSCIFQANGIGIRYGDNYTSRHKGSIFVSNSRSVFNNEYDVWNMIREDWSADTLKMDFINVSISKENSMYPQLNLYESD